MTTVAYYLAADGQTVGPTTVDELRRLHGAGQIGDDTPVVVEGDAEWGAYRSRVGAAVPPPVTSAWPAPAVAPVAVPSRPMSSATVAAESYAASPDGQSLLLRAVANPVSYVVGYLLFMLPTYVLPYFGSNSHLLRSGVQAINTEMGNGRGAAALSIPFYLHLFCLGVLVALAFARGKRIGKSWLVLFPALALAFDMLPGLSLIPLVPTAMHLTAIIAGVVVASAASAPARG